MSKVKIVQIAFMGDDGRTEYLDDKGRIWYDGGRTEQYQKEKDGLMATFSRWVTEWKQLDLPDEPEALQPEREE